MSLKLKQQYCDENGLLAMMDAIAAAIANDHRESAGLVFIGILDGGGPLARYLAEKVGDILGKALPVAYVDITLYRDDAIDTQDDPYSRQTEIPFAVKDKEIILVDDVLFTGRTVRAALTSIIALGRPRLVRLAVAVDRGFRELPIRADYVGCAIETSRNQGVRVRLDGSCAEPGIFIYEGQEC